MATTAKTEKNPEFLGQILVIQNGILKTITNTEEVRKELEKNNWYYRMITASGQFMVIDYDKDEARPYVKALLAKVNKLLEVKLLWFVIFLTILSVIFFVTAFVITMSEISDLKKDIGKLAEAQQKIQVEAKKVPVQKVPSVEEVKGMVGGVESVNVNHVPVAEQSKTFIKK